jgi:hypothetical protein
VAVAVQVAADRGRVRPGAATRSASNDPAAAGWEDAPALPASPQRGEIGRAEGVLGGIPDRLAGDLTAAALSGGGLPPHLWR